MKNYTGLLWGVVGMLAVGCTANQKVPALYGMAAMPGAASETASSISLPFVLRDVSTDKTCGYSEKNLVRVGGARSASLRNQLRYLNALKGPQGQAVPYER
ncbi:hypothetical protein BEN47_01955 [Hymenobacter lapidarius]|uniref:Uncharacterized protein n=1 Tax=Hymenobacter lapidarius TaxID=1908237 RepID=A0A1G1T2M8_9BACT|nr:hypothetical protein [Hymenobacter lapidarius]OGX85121.1 hypothetical protein BEN47_01955 [Hymenobacter lapidarius]